MSDVGLTLLAWGGFVFLLVAGTLLMEGALWAWRRTKEGQ